MSPVFVLEILGGLAILVVGGEALVRGASALALKVGMSALVVGLTVVALATSAPELAVTVSSILDGEPDLAVGNVVGSNIANVLLIVGVSALVLPLLVKVQLVRIDIPVMVGLSVLFLVLAVDGEITRLDGAVLFILLVVYIALAVTIGRRSTARDAARDPSVAQEEDTAETIAKRTPAWLDALLLTGGVALLVLGAQLLVAGAAGIASALGVSELVIGLTVVAIGTSLPELATSVVAVRRGQRDLAVGNVVGSSIFNLGAVMGIGALVSPSAIPVPPSAIALDIRLMIACSAALLPLAFTGFVIGRWEGALLLALYVAYTVYLLLAATEHDALRGFSAVMLGFVLPLVGIVVIALAAYEFARRRHAGLPVFYEPGDAP